MTCWYCNRMFGKTDIQDERKSESPNKLKQTMYGCTNCGAEFLVSERVLREPTVIAHIKNVPHK